jgi:acyl-CoA hydrolase
MAQATQGREMRKLGAAPDVALGSVHALTDDGIAVIASLTGSQLPAYASGAGKVVFVVGSQKIVKDLDEAMERLRSYVVPLESARARKAYGLPDTFSSQANKILLLQGEVQPGRITFLLLEEARGF